LAARNVLLDSQLNCKVADFGLSRNAAGLELYLSQNDTGPLKWFLSNVLPVNCFRLAPETIASRIYSLSTDIWSFGKIINNSLSRQKYFSYFFRNCVY
jgi:serine/threonine protein kinase